VSKSLKTESRRDWTTESENFSLDQIQTGALLRIADALEKIAQNHDSLIRDRDFYRNQAATLRQSSEFWQRSRNALRGQITKMKKARTP
jgi:hypothetical protein